ncbi:MAG: hypothetical protein SV598_02720 [Pseudomonadota bacterium]|nr:hypothetical protein [Pseudomonadota bacterium]
MDQCRAVDANVPFKLVDRSRFNEEKVRFAMDTNPDKIYRP